MEIGQGVQGKITALESAFTVLHLLDQHNAELFRGPKEAQRFELEENQTHGNAYFFILTRETNQQV